MNIGTPQRELGDVDVSRLREAILAQEQDAWLENNQRQQDYQVKAVGTDWQKLQNL